LGSGTHSPRPTPRAHGPQLIVQEKKRKVFSFHDFHEKKEKFFFLFHSPYTFTHTRTSAAALMRSTAHPPLTATHHNRSNAQHSTPPLWVASPVAYPDTALHFTPRWPEASLTAPPPLQSHGPAAERMLDRPDRDCLCDPVPTCTNCSSHRGRRPTPGVAPNRSASPPLPPSLPGLPKTHGVWRGTSAVHTNVVPHVNLSRHPASPQMRKQTHSMPSCSARLATVAAMPSQ
jgi:hypothetical protein